MYPIISARLAQMLAALAWSAGDELGSQHTTSAPLFEVASVWWNGLLPQLCLPATPEVAAIGIWNFAQGAKFRRLGEDAAKHPIVPIGEWRSLFLSADDRDALSFATVAYTTGWCQGKSALALAVRHSESVLWEERAIRDLARVKARLSRPSVGPLSPREFESAFEDGFFHAYCQHTGRWLVGELIECFPAIVGRPRESVASQFTLSLV